MSSRRAVLLAVLLALTAPVQAVAGAPQGWQNGLDRTLQQVIVKGESLQRVIVQARPGEEARVRALISEKEAIHSGHPSIEAFSAELNTTGTTTKSGVVWGVVQRPDLTVWSDLSTSSQVAGGIR